MKPAGSEVATERRRVAALDGSGDGRADGPAQGLPYHRFVLTRVDVADLIADTEREILLLVGDRDAATTPLYEMMRYHLGLDGGKGDAGKRIRPLLGLLAYMSLT